MCVALTTEIYVMLSLLCRLYLQFLVSADMLKTECATLLAKIETLLIKPQYLKNINISYSIKVFGMEYGMFETMRLDKLIL